MKFFDFLIHFFAINIALRRQHASAAQQHSKHPIIVMIAFDGFRYDYMERKLTPTLRELAERGSTAKYMQNEFPTITFPNFHSISTGMHVETHGVLGNKVFDDKLQECLSVGYEMFHHNEDIVPIWHLNENSGDGRYSGVMMWPGSSYEYQKKLPTFVQPWNLNFTWKQRVDGVISWLTNDTTPANLVLAYFEQPDEDGHKFGPDSMQVNMELRRINNVMSYYLQKLNEHGLHNLVNTIVVSDHGMHTINRSSILNLDDYLDKNAYTWCGVSPGLQIQPKTGFEHAVYANLSAASVKMKQFEVYKRQNIPKKWYYKNNKRCADIFVETKLSYVFNDAAKLKGTHGWDNKEITMQPIFIAQGPNIKQNYTIKPFQNINLYPFISLVLNLKPPPAHVTPNGTLNVIEGILVNQTTYGLHALP